MIYKHKINEFFRSLNSYSPKGRGGTSTEKSTRALVDRTVEPQRMYSKGHTSIKDPPSAKGYTALG